MCLCSLPLALVTCAFDKMGTGLTLYFLTPILLAPLRFPFSEELKLIHLEAQAPKNKQGGATEFSLPLKMATYHCTCTVTKASRPARRHDSSASHPPVRMGILLSPRTPLLGSNIRTILATLLMRDHDHASNIAHEGSWITLA